MVPGVSSLLLNVVYSWGAHLASDALNCDRVLSFHDCAFESVLIFSCHEDVTEVRMVHLCFT